MWSGIEAGKSGHEGERKSPQQREGEGPAQRRRACVDQFPPEVYKVLEGIAKEKKVSLAWVVREAAEQYLAQKWPLFKEQG